LWHFHNKWGKIPPLSEQFQNQLSNIPLTAKEHRKTMPFSWGAILKGKKPIPQIQVIC